MPPYEQPSAFDLLEETKWEMEGTRRAAEHYRQAAAAADPSTLPSGQRLLREIIPGLIGKITALQLQAADCLSVRGHPPDWAWPIQLLGAKELALITTARAIDGCSRFGDPVHSTIVTISLVIAGCIRDELEYRRWIFEQIEANCIAKEERNWEHRDVLAAFRARYPNANRKVWGKWRRKLALVREQSWSREISVHLGAALINALLETAPNHFTKHLVREGRKTTAHLRLSEETEAMMLDLETRAAVTSPLLLPMIIPPIPWRYV